MKDIFIGNKIIGENSASFIIAELSANHNQDINVAIESIKAAKKAGADAIKLQTYTADTITLDCDNEYFQIKQGTIWDGTTLHKLYQEAYTPWEWHAELQKVAEAEGLIFFSSPFDKTSVDLLESLNVPAYKIASLEITDIPLIEYVASKRKPMIISTGIANISDIDLAIETCKKMNNDKIIILKCTTAYPTPFNEINLKTIPDIEKRFNVFSGLSDHTMGNSVAIASVALGAKVIEKHFILNRNIGGPDASFSMEPEEFKNMVQSIREVEQALGNVNYELTDKTVKSRSFCRSLFVVENVKKGDLITEINIRSIRPGNGMHPKYYNEILGKIFTKDIERGTPLQTNLFE